MSFRSTRRALSMQTLESRLQYAADLNLAVVNGDLTLTGDGDSEFVALEEVRGSGITSQLEFLKVTGFNGTTINGQAQVTVLANNLRNVTINLNGGNDGLDIQNLKSNIAGANLSVKLGGGDDQFAATDVVFGGNITIEAEGGDDDLFLDRLSAGNLLKIDLGNDDDELDVLNSTAKNFEVFGRNGDDVVVLSKLAITDKLFADMGDGDDDLTLDHSKANLIQLDGGDDEDTLTLKFDLGSFRNFLAVGSTTNFETVKFVQA